MPKYVIEREIPGAGKLSPQELQGISQKSCSVLRELGPQIQWLESYVTVRAGVGEIPMRANKQSNRCQRG